MNKKKFLFLNLLLFLIIFTMACSEKDINSIHLNSKDPIGKIINSKGSDYDFLDDKDYIKKIEAFIEDIKTKNINSEVNYTIGHLDNDNIPEIAVFIGKNPKNQEDEGSLKIYKFNGIKYEELDSVSMNFDVSNYQMEIGNISKKEKGIFLNNNVGKDSGMTYGFKLEGNKLKSILNSNKINLISIFTKNKIKDINNDGILEFSVYTVDPETKDSTAKGSDKMIIWYKWDGNNSAEILKVDRKDLSEMPSNGKVYKQLRQSLKDNFSNFIDLFSKNKDNLSFYDNTKLLNLYIDKLKAQAHEKSIEIESLFDKHQEGKNLNHIFDKYGVNIEKLNSLEYLNREKVLKDEIKIKENLIENINLGYKLKNQDGSYYYLVDYKKLLNLFEDNITREFRDYLNIHSLNSEKPFLDNGNMAISDDELVDRILLVEGFKMIYPYSTLYEEVDRIYESYLYSYLYGDNYNSKYNTKTERIKDGALEDFKEKISKYQYTNFADVLEGFIETLEKNSYRVNENVKAKLDNRLN